MRIRYNNSWKWTEATGVWATYNCAVWWFHSDDAVIQANSSIITAGIQILRSPLLCDEIHWVENSWIKQSFRQQLFDLHGIIWYLFEMYPFHANHKNKMIKKVYKQHQMANDNNIKINFHFQTTHWLKCSTFRKFEHRCINVLVWMAPACVHIVASKWKKKVLMKIYIKMHLIEMKCGVTNSKILERCTWCLWWPL